MNFEEINGTSCGAIYRQQKQVEEDLRTAFLNRLATMANVALIILGAKYLNGQTVVKASNRKR